jgi:Uma2 family endonuclease
MAPERATHVRMKYRIARLLDDAITRAGLPCEMFIDGMSVQVDATTSYVPDVLVRCGVPLAGETLRVTDPLILVEVLPPATLGVDTGMKLADYFRIASVRHYLIVRPETRTVIHHGRDDAGAITTRIVRDGALTLDPPGIELRDLFG